MDGQTSLPDSINPNNFPAKLWRLVNNPAYKAISWDDSGEIIAINQHLFETQILSPRAISSDNVDSFKTTNFSSFVRQLNLYGFRKVDAPVDAQPSWYSGTIHYFYNSNFQRNRPELVANLRRLTVDNKAKLQAGLTVNCRPPSRNQWWRCADDDRVSPGSSSNHPYYPIKAQATKSHIGTPVPPRYLLRGHGATLPPTVFAIDKAMPAPLSHHYAGLASGSNAVQVQQRFLVPANQGSPSVTAFNPRGAQYQPGYYSTGCLCCHPNLVAPHAAGGGLQTGLFSPQSYYQAGYPMDPLCHRDHQLNVKNKESHEEKKCDINLDVILQIADEVMQTPPSNYLIKVETPEKSPAALEPPSNTCDSSGDTARATPACSTPIILSVSSNAHLVKYRQQDDSVVSVPEQMPEDAIFEVTSDHSKDSEVICVEVGEGAWDTSQDDKSSDTGSTADL
ncbi:heat shock factor protein 5 [Mugil cephalus]|uniref:heat shock factor protein 5 n=1 Tax=Mugil cephalus TaxID=48193 RepID=UPI001FB7DBC2|nr:heat shock factor protein 5 [Mugil cephalus]XP_047462501.1 heat shock factor protein 5 [Mugil cephalus]XP_047462502.1 heat shock factor protein 5 [Mugil cephalus]